MSGKPTKLLLIGGDPAEARRLRESLVAAAGGSQFEFEWAERLPVGAGDAAAYDAILLDLGRSKGDEPDAFAAARARWPGEPIVILGDAPDAAHDLLAAEGGAQEHLLKGRFDGDLLVRTIRHAIARRHAERALAEKQSLLRNIVDTLPDHVFAKDLGGRFLIVNTATQQFFGAATADDLIGKTDFDLFPADVAGWFHAEERELLRSGQAPPDREAVMTDHAGARRWVLTHKAPMRDADGRVVGIVGINRDITERKLAEERLREANVALARREQELLAALADVRRSHEQLLSTQLQLVQAEKMESVGRLAAGVAHEVKNPLAVIAMGLEYLAQCPPGGDAVPAVIKGMGDAVGKADQVIRGLLDFSAPSTLSTRPHDLNALIDQALVLVRHELNRARVVVRKEPAADLPAVRVDGNKIEQVFVNLLVNAAHAMKAGGTLTVRTSRRRPDGAAGDDGLLVVAEVEDTGPGIPGEQLSKVFDPFFTTKPPGKGTGLGLTVSRTIVELHGGQIDLANRAQGGLRATVAFAADREAARPAEPGADHEPRPEAVPQA